MRSKRTRLGRCLSLALPLFAMMFVFWLNPFCAVKSLAAEVVKGDNIPYNRYLPGATYSTHMYSVDGRIAYCIESEKQAVPSGTVGDGRRLEYGNAPMLVLALHYGYGGEGAWQMKRFFSERYGINLSDEQQYLYTHIVANYAYVGANMSSTPGQFYKGLSAEIAEASGINEWIRFLGRVLGGSEDYTGKKVSTGYITAFDTSTQTIAVIGSVEYRSDTPPTPPVEEKENVGKITVTKSGESLTDYVNGQFIYEEKGLQGAKFKVCAANDIVSKGEVIYAKDAEVGSFTTNENGIGSLENLYPGDYLLTEEEAPLGYRKSTEEIAFTLSKEGGDLSLMTKNVTVFNERMKLHLNLSKKDGTTNNALPGAKFAIYTKQEIKAYDGRVLATAGDLLKEAVSDGSGIIDFNLDCPVGEYEVKEIEAPFGYVLSGEPFNISFTAEENSDSKISHSFQNTEARGKLVIIKEGESLAGFVDGQFVYESMSLAGAEFDLYAKDANEPLCHLITDEEGRATADNLSLGGYTLVETKAPYGMILPEEPVEIEIGYVNQTTPVVLKEISIHNERERIDLKVEKKETGSGKALSGGMFELRNKEDLVNAKGEVIVPADTLLAKAASKEGNIAFDLDLPHGVYVVKETEGIPGYLLNGSAYEIQALYETVPKEGIRCTILNSKKPEEHPAPEPENPTKVLGTSKNNYVTEDEGKGGYSVLIRERNESEENENAPKKAGFQIAYGVLLVLTGGGIFIGKKIHSGKDRDEE